MPHGFATAFHTPQGVILHSGDFKLDMTPVDSRLTDLAGLGHLAKDDGIRLFLCDSTNAEEEGFSASETSIGQSIQDLFRARDGRRIIIACFASHIHRVQQIADAAIACGRTIATLGRSMNNNVALARQMGLLHIPDNKLRDIEDVDDIPDGELCVISTGSQGEPLSALARMASGDSKWLSIREGDCVILSSHPIPGNEMGVTRVIDGLVKRGAEVVHSATAKVHATGHAKAEELRVMHSIVQPEWFIPVHGEYRHMATHARLATGMGTGRRPDHDLRRRRLGHPRRQGPAPGRGHPGRVHLHRRQRSAPSTRTSCWSDGSSARTASSRSWSPCRSSGPTPNCCVTPRSSAGAGSTVRRATSCARRPPWPSGRRSRTRSHRRQAVPQGLRASGPAGRRPVREQADPAAARWWSRWSSGPTRTTNHDQRAHRD